MICRIKINQQPMSLSDYDTLRKLVSTVRLKVPSDMYVYTGDIKDGRTQEEVQIERFEKELGKNECIVTQDYGATHICDIIALLKSLPKFKFEVEEVIMTFDSREHTPELLIHKFYEMSEKLNKTVNTFNQRCNVSIGGNTLIQLNEVKVETDFCTEALQSELDNGWRIIAVCVQPDGRRPDYVLGKTR